MYALDYNLGKSISFYLEQITNYSTFYTILIAVVVLGVVMIINVSGHNNYLLTIAFDVISFFLIFYHFGLEIIDNLDSCIATDFLNNICFYFVNTIVVLIITSLFINNNKVDYLSRVTLIVLYLIILLNLFFALYIAYAIGGNLFITLGNIYPMVLIGNLISIIVYIYVIIQSILIKSDKYYDKKKHLLYSDRKKESE